MAFKINRKPIITYGNEGCNVTIFFAKSPFWFSKISPPSKLKATQVKTTFEGKKKHFPEHTLYELNPPEKLVTGIIIPPGIEGSYHVVFITAKGKLFSPTSYIKNIEDFDKHVFIDIARTCRLIYFATSDNEFYSLDPNNDFKKCLKKMTEEITASEDRVKKISCGLSHILVLTINGRVFANGSDFNYQLGRNNQELKSSTLIKPLENIVDISAGNYHSIFLDLNGNVYVCGRNQVNQLGLGHKTEEVKTPFCINQYVNNIIKIFTIENSSFFVGPNQNTWMCGSSHFFRNNTKHKPNIYKIEELRKLSYFTGDCSFAFVIKNRRTFFYPSFIKNSSAQSGIIKNIEFPVKEIPGLQKKLLEKAKQKIYTDTAVNCKL